MRRFNSLRGLTAAVLFAISLIGCGGKDSQEGSTELPDTPPATVEAGEEHDHPTEGPHGGHLIELGQEDYHAELVHNEDAGTVTIYILDGTAEGIVPIEAQELRINLMHDGQPEQFVLTASPTKGDPEGQASRFVSNEAELGEDLHAEGAEARLVLKMKNQSYTGLIEHEHRHDDHEGHLH